MGKLYSIEGLNQIHKDLRKYRYFYYECSNIKMINKNTISDYDYDILEKEYSKQCDYLNISNEYRITNYVGFDIGIPMTLLNISPSLS